MEYTGLRKVGAKPAEEEMDALPSMPFQLAGAAASGTRGVSAGCCGLPKADQAAGSASESFMLSFDRGTPPRALGARLDPSDGRTLFISSLESGDTILNEHNGKAQEDAYFGEQVSAGQFVVEINGIRGDVRQLEALIATSSQLSVVFMKPLTFECAVARNGRPLGLELRYPSVHGTSLLVEAVLPDGAAKRVAGPLRPQACDRVLTVNGKSGDSFSLIEGIKESGDTVHLGMCRLLIGQAAAAPGTSGRPS